MLGRRLIAAAIIIATMLVLLTLDFKIGSDDSFGRPGLVLCGLAILVSVLAATELIAMFRSVACPVKAGSVIMGTVAMVAVTSAPALWRDYPCPCPLGRFGWSFSGFVLGIVILFFVEMKDFDSANVSPKGNLIDRLGRSIFVLGYLGMLFGFLIPHRFLYDDNAIGLLAIITVIATVKLSDSFAYFAGKQFGTIKLAPRLSPGKTLQGSFGGFVGGCLAVVIMGFVIAPQLFGVTFPKPWWWYVAYGVLVTAAGMMGDLAESLIKRDTGTKDSSAWLLGLGGILDILDSLIFAAPVSYFLWIIGDPPTV